ncbi:MAG TPA: CHAT domain-containing protein [Rhodanobacteraceae bacterium]
MAIGLAALAGPVRGEGTGLIGGSAREEKAPAGQTRTYRLTLERGQASEITLRQRDAVGLELRWKANGAAPTALATEAGRESIVRSTLIAAERTTWELVVAPSRQDRAFRYTIAATAAHSASPADRDRAAAVAALADAQTLRAKGDKDLAAKARALFRTSIDAWQKAGDACGARNAYVALAGLEHEVVDAAAQKAAAQASLDQPCETGVADRALAERLLGSASINQGDFAAGTRETERAVASFKETGDRYQEGIALRNLGLAYAESGEVEKALAITHSALSAAETVGDGKLLALVRNDLAFMYNARGEFALAVDAYRETLDALRANPYPMAEAVAWINLGIAYGQLGDGEQALAAYAKGESVAASIDCWSCLAEIAVDRGDDLFDGGDVASAEKAYQHALEIAKAHDLVRQRAEALRGLGRSAMAKQDWTQARTLLESARDELHRTNGRVNESVVDAMLGDLDSRLGHLDAARASYEQALTLAREADNEAWQAVAHASLARVSRQAGDLDGARREIEEAIALIESERSRINAPDLRTSYFGTKRAYYEFYVDVLMQSDRREPGKGRAAQALIVAERARARELQEQLAERAIDIAHDVDPALIAAQGAAEDQLHALAYQLSQTDAKDAAARAALQARIDEASQHVDETRGRIRVANPRYAELTHPAALGLDEIQHALIGPDVDVLEYWFGDERGYLWVVTGDSLQAFTLPGRAEIERATAALRDRLLAPAQSAPSVSMEQRAASDAAALDATAASATALADRVLPAAARASLKHDVAIVADGGLQGIPFAVLEPARGTAHAFVYLPSIGTLRGLRSLPRSGAPAHSVAVLADPVFRADDARLSGNASVAAADETVLSRAASEAGIGNLRRLPHTREEAEAIAAMADASAQWVALDFAANRDATLGARWQDYAIAHFATHALLNAEHPELSGIVLSLYDRNGRAEDGFVRVNDIYRLHVPADLVVLSVCDSAVGKSVGAEGASTLARAFFYAGTRRVVASLWPVDDRASVAFMRAFYRALLQQGRRPQDALVDAEHEMQREARWRAPYYWSGYVLQGDWR